MSTRANVRLISFCLFLILAMLTLSATLIYSAGFQDLQSYMTIEFQSGLVSLKFGNNAGSNINSSTCKVVYNDDKSKFKITGITPTISNGSVTNLSALTNSSGAEFYYFATNSSVLNTTSYTDPGTTYYISGLGTDANPACETWYDSPNNRLTLYATFMTPTHTSATSLSRGTNAGNVIFSHSVTQLPSASFVEQATPSPVQLANLIVVPNSVLSVESSSTTSSLDNKSKKDEVNAPPQSKTGSFFVCSLIKTVVLSNSVRSITDYQFWGCTNLTKIFIPEGIVRIGDHAFSRCSGLASITMPNSVADIGIRPFYGCSGLISMIIPESVTLIRSYAFSNCSSLTNITISKNVTKIRFQAFGGCSKLTSVIFADTSKTWTVNSNTISVTDPAQNATYLTNTYNDYTWTKNS